MSNFGNQQAVETPSKRRLSLRLGPESSISTFNSDKKPRIDNINGTNRRNSTELVDELEQPHTATSARFTHSTYSSPTSSIEDNRERSFRDRIAERSDGLLSVDDGNQRRTSYPSPHTMAGNIGLPSASSSRQPPRFHNNHTTPSTSLNPSRNSSPPPSFNLSSGQPLLNPPQKTQAAFVGKLYSMLEDDDIVKTGLIYWSAEGTTFTCPNPQEFSKIVLPRFFKHNNWQSFVRQLNMYSFNKVNDIYTTSVDPQAWEFRHSLFRRGEPHLLAKIKRKSSRPSAQDGGQPISPTEEITELARPVAGWMKEPNGQSGHGSGSYQHPNVLRLASPPQRNISYPYSGPNEDSRPTTTGGLWESRQPTSHSTTQPPISVRMPPPIQELPSQSQSQVPRFHPDPSRAPLSGQRILPPSYSDTPYAAHPNQAYSVEALSNQIVVLEEKLQKMTEVLNNDRIEYVRYNLDFTSYLLQMVGWTAGDQPSLEMKALQDTLNRQNGDMRQKYEALMASDALAIMASGEGQQSHERGPDRDRDDRRSRFPFETVLPGSTRSVHANLPTPRLPSANLSRGVTPLPSPGIREYDVTSRPPSGFTSTTSGDIYPPNQNFNLNLPLPLNLTRSSNPNVSYFPTPSQSSGQATPSVNGLSLNADGGDHSIEKDDPQSKIPRDESKSILNLASIKSDNNDGKSQITNGLGRGVNQNVVEIKPKAGLRNLLN
ncbi:uncharacterized protein L201_006572 [Kwoniella dendrophila CBS 6074]|uniref:HSF-type DNA-binding domain-containing protein n=1 Tax=Kwoniella dendrophila CBS 6074 TaxID=1295534 RepID=A0AAX4K233_9TREE